MANSLKPKESYEFGSFRLDRSSRVLLRQGEVIALAPKIIDTLLALIERAGEPVSKEDLMEAVWPGTFVEENNLAHNISVLRKTLGDGYIETIPKRGYRFVGAVREATPPSRRRPAVLAAAVAGLAVAAWLAVAPPWRSDRPRIRSLAVLPLQNLSADPQQDYLADGLTEALISELAQIRTLRVISRTSAMRYKASKKAVPEVARELRVEALVEGSVARFGDRVRITAQLIEAGSDGHLWAETYEQDLRDVPALWSEVAATIAREVRITLTPEVRARLAARGPANRAAFEAYLRGRYYWNKRTARDIEQAVEHFRQAIDQDPAYARAYAGLADCYNQLGTHLVGARSPAETRPLATAAARRALEIDPELAEAHATLAYCRLYDWDWAAAEQGFRRAIQLNPSYASAHLWYAHYFSARGRVEEALREAGLARDLDPLSPILETQVGWVLCHARRYDEAIPIFEKVLADNPDHLWALWQLGSSYSHRSRFEEAIQTLEKAAAVSGRNPAILSSLAQAYGRAGRKAEARKLLEELLELAGRRYVSPVALIHAYTALEDKEKTLEWLERAYQERSNHLIWLAVAGWQDPVREDPRFQELMRRVGLP